MPVINKIKPVRVQWHISGDIECPHCEHDNDFMEVDEYYFFSAPGENKKNFSRPIEFVCTKCHKEFLVDGADH